MRGVILAAGDGSRMGEATDDLPKAFVEIDGRTLYDRQREALADHVDALTVVLGYGAERARERVASAGTPTGVESVETVVVEKWDEYDNAESLRRALDRVDDDALVLNGDVVVAPDAVDRLVRRFQTFGGSANVVGCLPGVQDDHTAVRCDDAGEVVAYGEVPGHRHAGLGVVSRRHREDALAVLDANRRDWYPRVYPETPTRRVVLPPEAHVEVNRPEDLERARERLPLADRADSRELDARRG